MPSALPAQTHDQAALLDRALVSSFLENVPDNVYFKDRDSRFIAVSASMLRHLGLESQTQIIGKTDFELFADGHANLAFADEQRIVRTSEPIIGKLERESWSDGRFGWVLSSKLPLRNDAGEVVGTFGISKDVTAAKALKESLEKMHQELTETSRLAGMAEVATGVLHNVGNVLNSLNVSATVLADGLRRSKADSLKRVSDLLRPHADALGEFLTADPKGKLVPEFLGSLAHHLLEERAQLLQEVRSLQENIDHIKEIVTTQQTYATMVAMIEPLAPISLFEDSLRMNAAELDRHDIAVVREFSDCPLIEAERGKVLQILINLIRNARNAVEESAQPEKRITLRLLPEGGQCVRFVVADNGVGIAPENLQRIFGHGFTTRAKGHGFGLHTSALAAKEMRGRLTAESAGPGQGAVFILDLPINAAAPSVAAASA